MLNVVQPASHAWRPLMHVLRFVPSSQHPLTEVDTALAASAPSGAGRPHLLRLAQLVLCCAVQSERSQEYIDIILGLRPEEQDALMQLVAEATPSGDEGGGSADRPAAEVEPAVETTPARAVSAPRSSAKSSRRGRTEAAAVSPPVQPSRSAAPSHRGAGSVHGSSSSSSSHLGATPSSAVSKASIAGGGVRQSIGGALSDPAPTRPPLRAAAPGTVFAAHSLGVSPAPPGGGAAASKARSSREVERQVATLQEENVRSGAQSGCVWDWLTSVVGTESVPP
jgi:hypothetical protein